MDLESDPEISFKNTSFVSELQLKLSPDPGLTAVPLAFSTLAPVPAPDSVVNSSPPDAISSDSGPTSCVEMAMDKVTIPKFTGLTTEDPQKFLDNFRSYSLLYNLNGEDMDARKVAAFHLKLAGPALIWCNSLTPPDDQTKSWSFVEKEFLAKYINVQNNPVLLAEAELFQQLRLAPGQPIEEFHSLLVEKGVRLGKTPWDILLKFVSGLPQQLSFYVRARGPVDHQAALSEALIGEAHGYCLGAEVPVVAAMAPTMPLVPGSAAQTASSHNTVISDLQAQISELTKMVRKLHMSSQKPSQNEQRRGPVAAGQQQQQQPRQQQQRQQPGPRDCQACGASGHNQRACNLQEGATPRLHFTCTICGQGGHGSVRCKLRQTTAGPLNGQSQAVGSGPVEGQ